MCTLDGPEGKVAEGWVIEGFHWVVGGEKIVVG